MINYLRIIAFGLCFIFLPALAQEISSQEIPSQPLSSISNDILQSSDPVVDIDKINNQFLESFITQDKTILPTLLQRTSQIIEVHSDSVSALQLRFNIYLALNQPQEALLDLKAINRLEPVAERILGECLLLRQLDQTDEITKCYQRTIDAFDQKTINLNEDINYLITKLLINDSDQEAMQNLKDLIEKTNDPLHQESLLSFVKELLGESVYSQLHGDNK